MSHEITAAHYFIWKSVAFGQALLILQAIWKKPILASPCPPLWSYYVFNSLCLKSSFISIFLIIFFLIKYLFETIVCQFYNIPINSFSGHKAPQPMNHRCWFQNSFLSNDFLFEILLFIFHYFIIFFLGKISANLYSICLNIN